MERISTVSYSILINGISEGKIQPLRGIRQENSLSQYIFIICREYLGRELVKQIENPRNHLGILTHRNGPKIPFLMFVEDCIIFAKAPQNACSNINRILNNFYATSGQLVNFHKSLVQISSNIQGAIKSRLGEALSIPLFNDISKYLSCLIIQGRIKRSTFFEVILKSKKKLASWKACFLSRASKIVLIKANLTNSHVMNCFKLTKRNNKNLDRINKNFLWLPNVGSNESKGFLW